MFYFGFKFVKFFVELPTFERKICLFSLKIISFYCPKTKFKHTLSQSFYYLDRTTKWLSTMSRDIAEI